MRIVAITWLSLLGGILAGIIVDAIMTVPEFRILTGAVAFVFVTIWAIVKTMPDPEMPFPIKSPRPPGMTGPPASPAPPPAPPRR